MYSHHALILPTQFFLQSAEMKIVEALEFIHEFADHFQSTTNLSRLAIKSFICFCIFFVLLFFIAAGIFVLLYIASPPVTHSFGSLNLIDLLCITFNF